LDDELAAVTMALNAGLPSLYVGVPEVQILAAFAGSLLQVDPVILEHQLPRVDLLSAIEALAFGIVHVGQGLQFLLSIPVDPGLPVDHGGVYLLAELIFREYVLTDVLFTQDLFRRGIDHVLHELPVFVVADLRLVHIEGLNGDRLGLGHLRIGRILVAGAHDVAAQGDIVHPVGVHLVPRRTVLGADELPLTTLPATGQDSYAAEIENGTSFHGLPFLTAPDPPRFLAGFLFANPGAGVPQTDMQRCSGPFVTLAYKKRG